MVFQLSTLFLVFCSTLPAATIYDLKTDWSDTNNPSGVWGYRQGSTLLPHNNDISVCCGGPSSGITAAWAPSNHDPYIGSLAHAETVATAYTRRAVCRSRLMRMSARNTGARSAKGLSACLVPRPDPGFSRSVSGKPVFQPLWLENRERTLRGLGFARVLRDRERG
jgi:hypothetical protein